MRIVNYIPDYEMAINMPSVNPSVKFYCMRDESAGGIAHTPYTWFYTVALPHAIAYVKAMNVIAGYERFVLSACY